MAGFRQLRIYESFTFGTTGARVSTSVASTRFVNVRLTNAATSGFVMGANFEVFHTSTSSESRALRGSLVNKGTVSSGVMSAVTGWVEFSTGGTNSGLTAALHGTVSAIAGVNCTGTPTACNLEFSLSSTSTPTGNESFIRTNNTGVTKMDGYLLDIYNGSTTTFFQAASDTTISKKVKCRINGTPYWLCFTTSV